VGKDARYQRIGDVLVATGLLSQSKLDEALWLQRVRGCRLGEVIVEEGLLTQDQINWALSKHFGIPYVDVHPSTLDPDLARSLRPGLLYQHRVIPLVRIGNAVTLAMADPTDTAAIHEVSQTLGCEVQCAIANADAILAALEAIFTPEELRLSLREAPSPSQFAKMLGQPTPRRRLGEILLDSLLITEEQLGAALAKQSETRRRLGEILIEDGVCSEDQINWALARHLDVPYIDISPEAVEPQLLELVPYDFLREHQVVPFMRVEREIVVAMADPLDEEAVKQIAAAARCKAVVAIAPRRDIERVLSHFARPATPGAAPLPADLAGAPHAPEQPPPAARAALSPDAVRAFREALQHCPIPAAEKIRAYYAADRIVKARQRGGPEAARAVRREAFASLSEEGVKLALQLLHQAGSCDVPALRDEEFTARYGRAGVPHDSDRRFVVDRRVYERTILTHARRHKLDPLQIDNAVMAARAHVLSGGEQKILLITEGERELATALTQIIHLAQTRETPRPAPAGAASRAEPDRRQTSSELQEALQAAIAGSGLQRESRAKVIRAFRFVRQTLGTTPRPGMLAELFQRGTFAGFSPDEARLLERLLQLSGYSLD